MTAKVHEGMGGDSLEVEDGGVVQVKAGGRVHVESGASITLASGAAIAAADGSFAVGSTAISEAEAALVDQAGNASSIGAVAVVSGLSAVIERIGSLFKLTLTLAAVRITVTDAGGPGSSGSLKLFDFVEGAIAFLGSRVNVASVVEGAALTTGAGDAVFSIGLGTVAIAAAANGVLSAAATYDNIGAAQSITDSGGTGAGEKVTPASAVAAPDGTAAAVDLIMNWSGTAATIDANSTIDITGTVTVIGMFMGDD